MTTSNAGVGASSVVPDEILAPPAELAADVQHLTKVYFSRSGEPVLALSDVSVALRRHRVL
ncbi:MAG: hypothetical protein JWO67_2211, partial [Streptosporangiaceae bacterium]|nr:hypothetical protein [Streptosporangiaceae bacterium]